MRDGTRKGGRILVLHLVVGSGAGQGGSRAALAVGKGVGTAVERNRVARKIRHCLRPRLGALPDGSCLVVRALPGSSRAGSDEIARELDRMLSQALRVGDRGGRCGR